MHEKAHRRPGAKKKKNCTANKGEEKAKTRKCGIKKKTRTQLNRYDRNSKWRRNTYPKHTKSRPDRRTIKLRGKIRNSRGRKHVETWKGRPEKK